jgi:hypothetical protein
LAGGFEKIRNEHSILVWDVRGNPSTPTSKIELKNEPVIYMTDYRLTSETKRSEIRPNYETGTSESCHSLKWNPHNMNQLLAGVNGKSLKIFDIRGTFI